MAGRLVTLRLYYLACFAALGAYLPFFPRWLEARGIEGLRMAAIAALFPAMGVLGPPVFGVVADAFGLRGALLRIACLGACLSFGAIAASAAAGSPLGFEGLFVAMLGFAVFHSPMTMMADVVILEQPRGAGPAYGQVRLWGSMGFLVAALALGRFIALDDPLLLPLAITVALGAAAVVGWQLPARAVEPEAPVLGHARALLRTADFRLFLVVSFLAEAANASYDLCFSLHLRDLGSGDFAGVAWAAGVASEVALMAASPWLLERVPPTRLVPFALVVAAGRWALIAGVEPFPVLLAAQPLHAISFALWWIASLAHVKDRAPKTVFATAQGLFSAAVAAGSVAGMFVWGVSYRSAGGRVTFAAASGVAGFAFAVALLWGRRARQEAPVRVSSAADDRAAADPGP